MAFCSVCGNETKVEVILCPKCNTNHVQYKYKIVKLKNEKWAWLWLIPSFIMPFFGFIVFMFLGHSRPKASYYTLIGTVIGSCTLFAFSVFIYLLGYGIY